MEKDSKLRKTYVKGTWFFCKDSNSCCINDASTMRTERTDIGKLDTQRWQNAAWPGVNAEGSNSIIIFLSAKTFMASVVIIVINAIDFVTEELLIKDTVHTVHCKHFCIFSISSGSCSHLAASWMLMQPALYYISKQFKINYLRFLTYHIFL